MSEWLKMHSKTVDNVVLEIEKVKMKNTVADEINLNIITFVILGLKNELVRETDKNKGFEDKINELNQKIRYLTEGGPASGPQTEVVDAKKGDVVQTDPGQ